LLESIRKGQRWLTFIFVAVIGLVFVFFLGVGGSFGPAAPTGNAIVQLDDLRLTERDFARAREETENRLRDQLGDAFEQMGADRFVDSQALGALVNSALLASAAKEVGLHVTKEELRRLVQASPLFRDETGRFSPEAFDRFAAYNYGSQRAFIQAFTRDLLGQKLVQLLVGQTRVSDAEVDLRLAYELEEVRIAYVALPTDRLPEDRALDDAEVEAWAEENEEQLRALYEERVDGLAEPERVRARHVLILAPGDASPDELEQARARAETARARIAGGEAFEDVAAELSEDAGTAEQGGDLGLFARGENDPALEEAAFALEVGQLSEVIRSAYGFHVLRVEERQEAKTPDFDELRLELAREVLERERALEWADEKSRALAEAIEAGRSLEEAAREQGLTLERPPALKRRADGFVAGLGAAPDLLTTAFTLETGESSPTIFDLPDRRVLIQALEHTRPSEAQLAEARPQRRTQLELEKQNRVIQAWLDDYRSELEAEGRLRVNAELALGRA
jgi:peptidyl-prolyl cis-trans isomerase D